MICAIAIVILVGDTASALAGSSLVLIIIALVGTVALAAVRQVTVVVDVHLSAAALARGVLVLI